MKNNPKIFYIKVLHQNGKFYLWKNAIGFIDNTEINKTKCLLDKKEGLRILKNLIRDYRNKYYLQVI